MANLSTNYSKEERTNLIDQTRKWGIEIKLVMEDIKKEAVLRGYVEDLEFKEELNGATLARVKFVWCDLGEIRDVFHIEEDSYQFYWPIYDPSESLEDLEKRCVEYSKGFLEYAKIISFEKEIDRIPWAFNKNIFEADTDDDDTK